MKKFIQNNFILNTVLLFVCAGFATCICSFSILSYLNYKVDLSSNTYESVLEKFIDDVKNKDFQGYPELDYSSDPEVKFFYDLTLESYEVITAEHINGGTLNGDYIVFIEIKIESGEKYYFKMFFKYMEETKNWKIDHILQIS